MLQLIIDNCLKLEVTQIIVVQNVFQPIESYLESISLFSNAKFLHMYFVPLFLALSVRNYVNVMIAAISSHITIILLKWLFAEDRPYWWINETNIYTPLTRPELRQTYLTCETSAGSPSGHVMFMATVFYVGMHDILQSMEWYRKANAAIKYFTWNIFIVLLALVTISRLYFACHFLHQCLLGAGFGVIIAQFLRRRTINRKLIELTMAKAFMLGVALILLTVLVYCSHLLIQKDPQWSIRKAFNWCKDPYFVKPESTPIFSLVREFGLLFGLILCTPNVKRFNIKLDLKLSLPTVIGIMIANCLLYDNIPRWNGVFIFYGCSFLANVMFVVILVHIVPRLARKAKQD